MSAPDADTFHRAIDDAKRRIMDLQVQATGTLLKAAQKSNVSPVKNPMGPEPRRLLKGHSAKIYSVGWSGDSTHLVSASQDGKLVVWNARSLYKTACINLPCNWVMSVGFSPSGQLIASGGLDNVCSVFRIPGKQGPSIISKPVAVLNQHEGYLSCCRFLSDDTILTSSGDSTILQWDVSSSQAKRRYDGHEADVMSVHGLPNGNVFVSGSCDTSAKLWDMRAAKPEVATFLGHEADINSVRFLADGQSFVTASDDSSCALYDLRSQRCLSRYADAKVPCGVASVDVSKSGRFLFAAYEDGFVRVWDTLLGTKLHSYSHDGRVTCLEVSPNGKALATCGWDQLVRVYA